MVLKAVNATYTETYDLNTALNELSLLAIHTPQAGALLRMFHGFFEQYKKYKINGCNVRMVCASQQALTPDLVGLEAGSVDPRDVLNPILFKACTGEGINVLMDQIYNVSERVNSACSVDQHLDTRPAAVNAYYQLLGDDTWRKEHPQAGLNIRGLVPMVHKVVTTQPFKWTGVSRNDGAEQPSIAGANSSNESPRNVYGFGGISATKNSEFTSAINPTVFVSNGVTPMPWLDTAVTRAVKERYDVDEVGGTNNLIYNSNKPVANQIINSVPRVYMGCIVLPPAILQRLFFRLQISWSISFKDWRPSQDVGTLSAYDYIIPDIPFGSQGQNLASPQSVSSSTYFNIYHTAAAKVDLETGNIGKEVSSFTTNDNAEVEQILETGA